MLEKSSQAASKLDGRLLLPDRDETQWDWMMGWLS
jgi:hypothetical protein